MAEAEERLKKSFQEQYGRSLLFTIKGHKDFNLRRHKRERGGGGGCQSDPTLSIVLALNFCSLTDCQKFWYNCSLFVNTSFDLNYVTSQLMASS